MSIPTSVWFIIAAVALVLGLLMLRASQRAGGAQPRDRRRWAEQKEWEYLDSDPVLPSRWRYGTIHQGGPGVARNLVTGSVPTPEGRRLIYVFDHEQAGRISSVVCAVQRRSSMKGAFELRLPSAPLPDDAGLDLLEPVGERYAFVSDAAAIRPLITPRLARAADAIGEDVELLWGEDSWVLCTAPLDYTAEQLQVLLDQLVEVAGALEEATRSSRPGGPPVSPVSPATGPAVHPPSSGSESPSTAQSTGTPSARTGSPLPDPTAPGPLGGSKDRGSTDWGATDRGSTDRGSTEPRSAGGPEATESGSARSGSARFGSAGSGSAAAGWVRSLSNRPTELRSVDQGKNRPASSASGSSGSGSSTSGPSTSGPSGSGSFGSGTSTSHSSTSGPAGSSGSVGSSGGTEPDEDVDEDLDAELGLSLDADVEGTDRSTDSGPGR